MSKLKYICVLDFEATCWNDEKCDKSKMEIIEFPSILYKYENNKLEKISEFHEYVKPVIIPKLSNFCTELTGIEQKTVDSADIFENVFKRNFEWLGKNVGELNEVCFLTCGNWDFATQLPRELSNKSLKTKDVYKSFINIKEEFKKFYKTKAYGMEGMLKFLNLSLDGRHHSGIDDCRNISKILIKLVEDGHINFTIKNINK